MKHILLFSNKKEATTDGHNDLDESRNIINERNQRQNSPYCMIPFSWNSGQIKVIYINREQISGSEVLRLVEMDCKGA